MDWELLSSRTVIFLEQLLNGLTLGGVYALIAVGYTMVYGIIGLINFAHGEIYMMGAFLALSMVMAGMPWFIAFPLTIMCCALIGILIDRIAYKPLRAAPRLAALITAIGISLFLQNLALLIWGGERQAFPRDAVPAFLRETAFTVTLPNSFVNFNVDWMQIIIIVIVCLLMIFLTWLIAFTKTGMAMRAISQDRRAAELMGINVDKIIMVTFALGSALGAIAGILIGLNYEAIWPFMGYDAGIKAFAAAVLGGIGSVPGAVVGGIVLGIGETFGAAYISSNYRNGLAYMLMILVILIKPSGLMGKRQAEKV